MSDAALLSPAGEGSPDLRGKAAAAVWIAVVLSVVVALGATAAGVKPTAPLGVIAFVFVLVAARRQLLAWPTLVGALLVIVMLIPMRRYELGGGLPFALEPYRALIAVTFMMWVGALLVDPEVHFRATGLERPVILFGVAVLLSLVANPGRVSLLAGSVMKIVLLFTSFFAVLYLVAGMTERREVLDRLIKLLVGCSVVVAVASLYEWRSGVNLFNDLHRVVPLLRFRPDFLPSTPGRGDHPRAYGSAQHAIALGAALVMVLPLCVYLWRRTGRFIWMIGGAVLVMGALATGSRTAVVMLAVSFIMFLRYKPGPTIRMVPYLFVLLIVVQGAMPGTLGTFKSSFFPKQGLVSDEFAGSGSGTGRLQDVGPSLREWIHSPFVGQGFGTRLTSQQDDASQGFVNGRILDDQWLGSLLEIGLLGVFALIWLIVRALRLLKDRAIADDSDYGWLLTAIATSICAYAIGMLTFDAFSFIQVTLLFFVFLGLAAVALRVDPDPPLADPAPAPAPRQAAAQPLARPA